jgi:hypothetical protein
MVTAALTRRAGSRRNSIGRQLRSLDGADVGLIVVLALAVAIVVGIGVYLVRAGSQGRRQP